MSVYRLIQFHKTHVTYIDNLLNFLQKKNMNDFTDQDESHEFQSSNVDNYRQILGQDDQLNDDQSIIHNQCISSIYGQQIKLPRSRLLEKKTMFGITPTTRNLFYLANDQLPAQRSSLLFPVSRQLYELIESKQQLIELINIEQKRNNLLLDVKIYDTCRKLVKTIIIVCNSCGAKLLMKLIMNNQSRREDKYRLVYFDNTHIHQNQKSILSNKQFKYRLFLKEMQQQDKRTTVQQFLKILEKKYNITQKDFRYFFSRIQQKRDQEMESLLKFLQEHHSKIWMSHKISLNNLLEIQLYNDKSICTKDPDFFMFSMDYMYQNCKLYHKVCSISIIPGFVQNKQPRYVKWNIICFTGLNSFNDLVPFAFAFLNQKLNSIQLVSKVTQKFFKQFAAQPEVVVTPFSDYYAHLIESVKKDIKFNFFHIYDGICHIDSIGQQLKDTNDRVYYQNIILSKTKHQFQQNCELLIKKIEPKSASMQIFNQIIQIGPKIVFGLIETHQFIGLIFRHSANKYVLNLIRQIFTKEVLRRSEHNIEIPKIVHRKWKNNRPSLIKSIFLITRSVLRYNKDIIKDQILQGGYCQWRGQNYLGLPQVENIRINVKKEFLDLIMEQYGKIFEMQAAQRILKDPSVPEMKTFDIYDKQLKSVFVVSAYPQYANKKQFCKFIWKCNCLYSSKCGLPCAHQIKVAVVTDTSLMEQIHQLWLKKRVYAQNLKRRGRTKGTRRNTEK